MKVKYGKPILELIDEAIERARLDGRDIKSIELTQAEWAEYVEARREWTEVWRPCIKPRIKPGGEITYPFDGFWVVVERGGVPMGVYDGIKIEVAAEDKVPKMERGQ